jgi:hypothetical protein
MRMIAASTAPTLIGQPKDMRDDLGDLTPTHRCRSDGETGDSPWPAPRCAPPDAAEAPPTLVGQPGKRVLAAARALKAPQPVLEHLAAIAGSSHL